MKGSSRVRAALLLGITGLALAIAAVLVFFAGAEQGERIEWTVTLVGSSGQQRTMSYEEIVAMPSYEGRGGSFSSVGVVSGPYAVKGVPVEYLCDLVGGLTPSDVLFVSATDGYSMVFDYSQIQGGFDSYEPGTMRLVPHGDLELLLMYEQEGRPLSHNDGRPLRIATAGTEDLLTEGHYWVKWVDSIEVLRIGGTDG